MREYGGKVKANWVKGIPIYDGKEMKTYTYHRSPFYFVDTASNIVQEGYPLDSISIIPEFNKYLSELTAEEKQQYKKRSNNHEIFDFILKNITFKVYNDLRCK